MRNLGFSETKQLCWLEKRLSMLLYSSAWAETQLCWQLAVSQDQTPLLSENYATRLQNQNDCINAAGCGVTIASCCSIGSSLVQQGPVRRIVVLQHSLLLDVS
eukprot:g3074.t1